MNFETELVNIYIDKLNNKVVELQKAILLTEAHLELSSRIIKKLEEENSDLKKKLPKSAKSEDDF